MSPGLTRRAALSLTAAATAGALAGCGASPDGDDRETVAPDAIEAAFSETPTLPSERLPVSVADARLTAGVDQAMKLIEPIPDPITESAIPNAAIREAVADWRDHANGEIQAVDDATTDAAKFDAVRRAREAAGRAAGAWRYVEGERDREALSAAAAAAGERLQSTRNGRTYVGADPVRASVVHAEIDSLLVAARNELRRARGETGPPGDSADPPTGFEAIARGWESVEAAEADVDGAAHLDERLDASVDGGDDLRERFAAAASTLADRVADGIRDLPTADDGHEAAVGDIVGEEAVETPTGTALVDLLQDLWSPYPDPPGAEPGELARSTRANAETLVELAAFDRLRDRGVDGSESVETPAALESIRSAAIESVTTATPDPDTEPLAYGLIVGPANRFSYYDRRIREQDRPMDRRRLVDAGAVYRRVGAAAESVPEVADEVRAVLRG